MQIVSKFIISFGQIILWVYSKVLVKVVLRVSVENPEFSFEKHQGVVIISSHVSLFDPSIVVGTLSWREFKQVYPIRAMLAKWYFHSPILPIAYAIGCFPARPLIKRWKKYSGTSAAINLLKDNQTLGIYPEGQRSPDGRIPAKYGVVKILQHAPKRPVYLCKITRHSLRHFSVKLQRMDEIQNYTDPDKIMDEVYKLD